MSLDVYVTLPGVASEPREPVFSANITHNLGRMADAAGLYRALWCPGEVNITRAQQLIEPLRQGLRRLRAEPAYFKLFDDPGGWGVYEDLVRWVEAYLVACVEYPEALVSVRS